MCKEESSSLVCKNKSFLEATFFKTLYSLLDNSKTERNLDSKGLLLREAKL